VTLSGRRQAAAELVRQFAVSERRACRVLGVHRSSYRYRRGARASEAICGAVVAKSEKHAYWGYRKIHNLVVGDGVAVGRERVRVIRRREGLQLRRKVHKRRVPGASTELVPRALYPNHVWSYDFVFDGTEDGRTLKFLTIVDEFTRLDLGLPCRRGFTSADVVRVLEALMELWGRPRCIRSDNDSTFIATSVRRWLEERIVGTHFIDPGSPWQNPYNESFNGIFRTTCLNRWSFATLTEARIVTRAWQHEYNSIRPHGSLGGRSPLQFLYDWRADHPEIHTTMKIPESLT